RPLEVVGPRASQISTLSLHDALPISASRSSVAGAASANGSTPSGPLMAANISATSSELPAIGPACTTVVPELKPWPVSGMRPKRSEEHTSELQSREKLVCRHLLEQKR